MLNQNDYHGIEVTGVGRVYIGPLPTRKAIALYMVKGSTMHVMAYFRNEVEARRMLSFLDASLRVPAAVA